MNKTLLSVLFVVSLAATALAQSATPTSQLSPYGGLTVSILMPDGKTVAETTADVEGKFAFNNLKPGSYMLKVSNQAGSKGQAVPRDVATGAATGKRQMATSSSGGSSGSSNTVEYQRPPLTPRDAASGQASGKAASVPDSQSTPTRGVATARETGSGMATGKRQHGIEAQGESFGGGSSEQAQVFILDPSAGSRINTSRSNIKSQKAVTLGEGTPVTVDSTGQLVGNIMKTKHDTVKNSISNIR